MTYRVLVVDDNPDHRFLTQRALAPLRAALDLDVRAASDGPDAISRAQEARPDLVLLDVKMPGMDGFEVLVRIRAALQPRPPRIVLLSSSDSDIDRGRAAALGADDYVTKPIDAKGFGELVRSTVQAWARRR